MNHVINQQIQEAVNSMATDEEVENATLFFIPLSAFTKGDLLRLVVSLQRENIRLLTENIRRRQ